MNPCEVTLEILRHGKPHNQLLSPLTEYMALSCRREAVTVHVDMEQRDLLTYMGSLRYGNGDHATRQLQLGRLGAELGRILGAVPGLLADLSAGASCGLVHLRLISSAAELALLPFELIDAPLGFPGEGYPLSLQLDLPLVITREVRWAFGCRRPWPSQPKLLFAAAAPPGVGSIPFEAHLLALTAAIDATGATNTRDVLAKVLPRATLEDLRRECERQHFTHVHILAHGASYKESGQSRFGLALHGSPGANPVDIVSAERLAAALHPHMTEPTGEHWMAQPVVVSIASCDSGNQSQVLVPGASIAHTLHVAGVPLVVASQFPLTKRGSVEMTETLYSGLLGGEDPRRVLHSVRQRLRAGRGEHHDWASLVAYTSLHPDIERQLPAARYASAKRGITAAMSRMDGIIRSLDVYVPDRKSQTPTTGCGTEATGGHPVVDAYELIALAEKHARRMPDAGQYKTEAIGMLASTHKRAAEGLFRIAAQARLDSDVRERLLIDSLRELRAAHAMYQKAVIETMRRSAVPEKGSLHWVLCQDLALHVVFGQPLRKQPFTLASFSAQIALGGEALEDIAWAHGTLAELELLRISSQNAEERHDAACEAKKHVAAIVADTNLNPFVYYSTACQFGRYVNWWGTNLFQDKVHSVQPIAPELVRTAQELVDLLRPLAAAYVE